MKEKIFKIYPFLFWPLLTLVLVVIYWPSFNNFFFGDDFFNLMLSPATSLKQVINFFNLIKAPESFPFYRPLTTQFYFWLGFKLFGLNPLGFHLINFSFFVFSLTLIFYLTKKTTKSLLVSYLTTFFYSLSSSHFYRLYFLSQFQEIGLVVFYLLTIIFYLKFIETKKIINYFLTFLFLILSILSKETAITIPLSMLIIDFCFLRKKQNLTFWIKKRLKYILPFVALIAVYLFFRFFFFGFSKGGEYIFIFKIKSILNSSLWYLFWSIGIPEAFVNVRIFDPRYFFNPKFLTNFGEDGALSTLLFSIFSILCFIGVKLLFEKTNKIDKSKQLKIILFSLGWFFTTLLLVLFFPFHKFSYSLSLPLMGVSLILAIILKEVFKFSKLFFGLGLMLFILANYFSLRVAHNTHWAAERAKISKEVFSFFQQKYPELSDNLEIYFYDDGYCNDINLPIKTNKSEQLAYVLSDDKGLNVLYRLNDYKNSKDFEKKKLKIFYQDKTLIENICLKNAILVSVDNFFD